MTFSGQSLVQRRARYAQPLRNLADGETAGYHLPSSAERAGVDSPGSTPTSAGCLYALPRSADSLAECLALHLGCPPHDGQNNVVRGPSQKEPVCHTGYHTPTLSEVFDNRQGVSDAPPGEPIDPKNVNLDKLTALGIPQQFS